MYGCMWASGEMIVNECCRPRGISVWGQGVGAGRGELHPPYRLLFCGVWNTVWCLSLSVGGCARTSPSSTRMPSVVRKSSTPQAPVLCSWRRHRATAALQTPLLPGSGRASTLINRTEPGDSDVVSCSPALACAAELCEGEYRLRTPSVAEASPAFAQPPASATLDDARQLSAITTASRADIDANSIAPNRAARTTGRPMPATWPQL